MSSVKKLNKKNNLRNLNPILDLNEVLESSGRLMCAPFESEFENCSIIIYAIETKHMNVSPINAAHNKLLLLLCRFSEEVLSVFRQNQN